MNPDNLITTFLERRDDVTALDVAGEIDMATAPVFDTAIAEALADTPRALVIDLSAVDFLASAGLRILVATREKLCGNRRFAVVARGPTNRVIRLLELDTFLSLRESLEDALEAVSAPGRW